MEILAQERQTCISFFYCFLQLRRYIRIWKKVKISEICEPRNIGLQKIDLGRPLRVLYIPRKTCCFSRPCFRSRFMLIANSWLVRTVLVDICTQKKAASQNSKQIFLRDLKSRINRTEDSSIFMSPPYLGSCSVFQFFRTLKTCFSILSLTNLNQFPLRIFWQYQQKCLPPMARPCIFRKKMFHFLT